MIYPDFHVQVIRERAQWTSGLLSKLALDGRGVGLFASPSFEGWLGDPGVDPVATPGPALAIDDCGQLVWARCETAAGGNRPSCGLWRYNRQTSTLEKLVTIDPLLAAARTPIRPRRLWVGRTAVWLFDDANARVYGFAPETYQLVRIIRLSKPVIDVAFDGRATFYALEEERDTYRVGRYPTSWHGDEPLAAWRCPASSGGSLWTRPVALAATRRWLWVLDRGAPDASPYFVRIPLDRRRAQDPTTAARRLADPDCGPAPRPTEPPARCETVAIPRRRPDRCCGVPDESLDAGLDPQSLAVDCQDNLYVVFLEDHGPPRLVQFDPDAGFLATIPLPTLPAPAGSASPRILIGEVLAVVTGPGDELYLVTDLGLARFAQDHVPIGESGVYYSRTLDNGREDGTWHRVALRAQLPPATRLLVEAVISNDAAMRASVDSVLESGRSVQARRRELEDRLGPSWVVVADLRGPDEPSDGSEAGRAAGSESHRPVSRWASPINLLHDALFVPKEGPGAGASVAVGSKELHRGRYLWLKLTLSSYEQTRRPAVRELQVFHPRLSYLRYLPATYQEVPGDPSTENPSRAFLERFLALFETFLWGLDVEIDHLFEYFDPGTAPAEFLPWLARWVDLALEEEWDEGRKRALIGRAASLYERKGTRTGLAELIQLVTDRPVRILEDGRLLAPVPLGAGWQLGRNTFVRHGLPRGFRLGDSSVLGQVALRSEAQDPTDPFAVAAHRFTVLLFGDRDAIHREEPRIRRLIDENKPAHTVYALRVIGEGAMGAELRVGINTRLRGGTPLRLGENTTVGQAITVSRTPPDLELGSTTRLGRGFELS